jgi:hypothetical protein
VTLTERLRKTRDLLVGRQRAYRTVFVDGPATDRVLRDLARFCRANDSTFHADPRMHAVLEGRREVFLRVCKHLKLDTATFLKMYGVPDDG